MSDFHTVPYGKNRLAVPGGFYRIGYDVSCTIKKQPLSLTLKGQKLIYSHFCGTTQFGLFLLTDPLRSMYCHTHLLDNGSGFRQRLLLCCLYCLKTAGFGLPSQVHSSALPSLPFHLPAALCHIRNSLLLLLIGFYPVNLMGVSIHLNRCFVKYFI